LTSNVMLAAQTFEDEVAKLLLPHKLLIRISVISLMIRFKLYVNNNVYV